MFVLYREENRTYEVKHSLCDNENDEQKCEETQLNETFYTEEPAERLSFGERVRKTCIKLQLYIILEPLFYAYVCAWITFAAAYYSALVYLVPYGTEGKLPYLELRFWCIGATNLP